MTRSQRDRTLKNWLNQLKKAGASKSPELVAKACQAWDSNEALRNHSLIEGGPLGKAGRFGDAWLVSHLLERGYPVTKKVLLDVFAGQSEKPAYVSESEAVWQERYERKRQTVLRLLADRLPDDAELKGFIQHHLIELWLKGLPSEPLRQSVDLAASLQPSPTTARAHEGLEERISWDLTAWSQGGDALLDAPGSRSLLQWAWMCREPVVLAQLLDLGHDPLHPDEGTGCPGWSLMGALEGQPSRRFNQAPEGDPTLGALAQRVLDDDRSCWSRPEWGELRARLKEMRLVSGLESPSAAGALKKPRM